MIKEPINEADQLKYLEQKRGFEGDKFLLASKIYAEQSHALRLNALNSVREYGLQTVKHLSLLNGGSIVVLLSLTGALIAKSDEKSLLVAISFAHKIWYAIASFAIGLVATGLVSALTYRNWLAHSESFQNPKQLSDLINKGECDVLPDIHSKVAKFTTNAIYLFGFLALLAFVVGAMLVAIAFSVLGV
ncbi:hypothetical protein MKL09_08850 [Methylobacterium sp. J-048]|uniref:hypothetical protein n=1 Tax=Methylobacterium sp. J-048 TaxID=2836635 RepID=UPI001FB97376|nr:hypothetical protein [Methylobacterium sp. J-048]MCJ2056662.1 hypothetical protein [Methylobacterium sp. J-048]